MIQFQINSVPVVKDPVNWKTFRPSFARHVDYRGMITVFSQRTVQWTKDGKRAVDELFDADFTEAAATVSLIKDGTTIFTGSIDFTQYRHKRTITEAGIQPSGFIMDWINNHRVQLNLQELVDIKGDAVTPFSSETVTIPLTDQLLIKGALLIDNGNPDESDVNLEYQWIENDILSAFVRAPWFQLGSNITEYNELEDEVFSIPTGFLIGATGTAKEEVTPFIETNWLKEGASGNYIVEIEYDIDYTLDSGTDITGSATLKTDLRLLWFDPDTADDPTLLETDSFTGSSHPLQLTGNFTGSITIDRVFRWYPDLKDGSKMIAYMDNTINGGSGNQDLDFKITVNKWKVTIRKNTTFPDTTCPVLLPWEAFLRAAQKLTGRNNCLRSTVFGRTDGAVHTYGSNGEHALLSITRSKLLRGAALADAPISTSFYDLFKIYDSACGPLGAGIVIEGGLPYIRVDKIDEFYKSSTASMFAVSPQTKDTVKSPFKDLLYNQVRVGYRKWENELPGLLQATHTERVYKTEINSIDSTYEAICEAIGAGPTIERIRRERDLRKDNRYDDDLVLIQLINDSGLRPQVGSDLPFAPTGMDNALKSYNYTITPARMAIRHAKLFANGVTTAGLMFIRGSGNLEVSSRLTGEAAALAEDESLSTKLAAPLMVAIQQEVTTVLTTEQLAAIMATPEQNVEFEGEKYFLISGAVKAINNNEFETVLVKANV